LLNDFIGLQKDTALVQVVGVIDAFNQSRIIAANASTCRPSPWSPSCLSSSPFRSPLRRQDDRA